MSSHCTTSRPPMPVLSAESIPADMKKAQQWLNWSYKLEVDRHTKAPLGGPGYAQRLLTFEQALANCSETVGLGFYLSNGWVGFDWDKLDANDREKAQAIIDSLPCYSETSVSGNGLHAICRVADATVFSAIASGRAPFEFYPNKRFFTVSTTNAECSVLESCDDRVRELTEEYQQSRGTGCVQELEPYTTITSDRELVIAAAREHLETCDLAIEGNGGSTRMVSAIRSVVTGFGLTEEADILDAIEPYNARCEPPFEVDDDRTANGLLKKVNDVLTGGAETTLAPLELLRRSSLYMFTEALRNETPVVPKPRKKRFRGMRISEMRKFLNIKPDWLVEDTIVAGQPCVFGAEPKCCKTSLLIELSVALATGGDYLGRKVPNKRKVLLITGESDQSLLMEQIDLCATSRGILPDDCDLEENLITETKEFPQFPSLEDQIDLADTIREYAADVVIVEPLYRGMNGDVNAGNVFQMGAALGSFTAACKPATLIIAHHTKKSATYDPTYGFKPPTLNDLSQAGVREWAGTWFLIGRTKKFDPTTKQHSLYLEHGGRRGEGRELHIHFDEPNWKFNLTDWEKHKEIELVKKEQHKSLVGMELKSKMTQALKKHPKGLTRNSLAEAAGTTVGTKKFKSAMADLISEGAIETCEVRHGRWEKTRAVGYKLAGKSDE